MSSLAFGGPSINELLSNVSIPASVCLPLINPEAVQKAFGTLFDTVRKQDELLRAAKEQMAATVQHNTKMEQRVAQLEKFVHVLGMATRVNQQVLGIESDAETVFSSVGLPLAPAAGGLAEAVAESGQAQDMWGKANNSNVKKELVQQRWGRMRALARIRRSMNEEQATLGQLEMEAFNARILQTVTKEIEEFSMMDTALRDRKIAETKTVCLSEASAATAALRDAVAKEKEVYQEQLSGHTGQLVRAEQAIQTLQMQVEITSKAAERAQEAGTAAGEAAGRAAREAADAAAKGAADMAALDAEAAAKAAEEEAARLQAIEDAKNQPLEAPPLTTAQIMEHVQVRVNEIVNEHMGDKFAADKLAQKAALALREVQQLKEPFAKMERELEQCSAQTAELREGKLDVEEVKQLEDRFRAAQERQRDKFAKETAALLRKMEVSVTGLDYAAQEMNKVLVDKADASDINSLRRQIHELANAAPPPMDDSEISGALSVHRCLSCNQSLTGPSSDGNLVLHNRFPAAAPPTILPPKGRSQAAVSPLENRPQSAVSASGGATVAPWEDTEGFRVTVQAPEARRVAVQRDVSPVYDGRRPHSSAVQRNASPINTNGRPHSSAVQRRASPRHGFSSQDSRQSGPAGYGGYTKRPLTALEHRSSLGKNRPVSAMQPTAHMRLPGQAGMPSGLNAEGVVSSTAPFAKRPMSGLPKRPVSAMQHVSVVGPIADTRPLSAMQ